MKSANPTKFQLKGKVWVYPGEAAWHFVNINRQASKEIRENFGSQQRGFGSIRVKVTVGSTVWETSIFPDSKSGMYLLPLKTQVRKKESISDGTALSFLIEVRP